MADNHCMACRWNQKVNSMKMGGAPNARSVQWKNNSRNPLLEMEMRTWLNSLSLCEVCAPIFICGNRISSKLISLLPCFLLCFGEHFRVCLHNTSSGFHCTVVQLWLRLLGRLLRVKLELKMRQLSGRGNMSWNDCGIVLWNGGSRRSMSLSRSRSSVNLPLVRELSFFALLEAQNPCTQ